MMIHDFDMSRFLLGEEPVELSAYGSCLVDPEIGKSGDFDTAVVSLRTASGKLCQISNSRRATYGYDQRHRSTWGAWYVACTKHIGKFCRNCF